jgi:tetratricopeptide (TPR) repeat protein
MIKASVTRISSMLCRFPGQIEPSEVSHYRARRLLAARIVFLCACLASCMGVGCMVWHPQWPDLSNASAPSDAAGRLEEADRLGRGADSRNSIAAAVAAYQAVLEKDPANYQVCVTLAQLHLLLGDAYASTRSGKRDYFQKAMVYAERAMFTNSSFRQGIQRGEPTWEACRVLGVQEMEAMMFWVNGVFYTYKEGQGYFGQVINFRWVQRARQVMEHMTAINPDWGAGALHFTWGVYFLSIPESIGGDRKKSAAYFSKAIEVGPHQLLNRWGRAKYFHVKMKNPQGFREDLEWVLAQDAGRSPGHAAWNTFFMRDARQMLDTMDRYF